MIRNILTGIDIGTHQIQTMVAEWDKTKDQLRVLGVGKSVSSGVRKGSIVDVDAATVALKESVLRAERMSGVTVRGAFFSFGGTGLSSSISKGNIVIAGTGREIDDNDVKRVLEASYATLLPFNNKVVLDRYPIGYRIDNSFPTDDPVGLIGSRLEAEVLFITAFTQNYNNLIKCAEKAGVEIEKIIASPIASSRAILSKRQQEVGVMLLDIGAENMSTVIFEQGVPYVVGSFPVGSASITNDIAIELKIPLDHAEKMKCSHGGFQGPDKKRLDDIISDRLSNVFQIVGKHLKQVGRHRLLPAGVVLTGGGAKLYRIHEAAKKILALPAQLGSLSVSGGLKNDDFDHSRSVVIGLCLLAQDQKKAGIEGFGPIGLGLLKRWFKIFLP